MAIIYYSNIYIDIKMTKVRVHVSELFYLTDDFSGSVTVLLEGLELLTGELWRELKNTNVGGGTGNDVEGAEYSLVYIYYTACNHSLTVSLSLWWPAIAQRYYSYNIYVVINLELTL